jgi:hypothetical protein
MWLWTRALIYMLVVGAGWLVIVPACILYWEHGGDCCQRLASLKDVRELRI